MSQLKKLAQKLKSGAVVAYPTDTCLGLGHDINSPAGQENLYKLKKMPPTKPVSILVNSFQMAKQYGEFSNLAIELFTGLMPGPYTILLPRTSQVPNQLNPDSTHIGIRHINISYINMLIDLIGNPISTTSANIHGQPTISNFNQLVSNFDNNILYTENLEQNKDYPQLPSTIIQVNDDKLKIIREGQGLKELQQKFARYIN